MPARVQVQLGCGGVRAGATGTGQAGCGQAGAGGAARQALESTTAQGRQRRSTAGALELVAYMVDTKTAPTATAPNNKHSKTCLAPRREAGGGRRASAACLLRPRTACACVCADVAASRSCCSSGCRVHKNAPRRWRPGLGSTMVPRTCNLTYQTQARVAALSRNKAGQSVNAKSDNLKKQTAERVGEGVEREKAAAHGRLEECSVSDAVAGESLLVARGRLTTGKSR